MNTAVTEPLDATRRHERTAEPRSAWYGGAVAIGLTLFVITAITQPYNQNELQQIAPYGGHTLSAVASGTRQPPLDPVLGALAQHLLGVGQLRQHLVPVVAGTGTLAVMALLLRHLRLGTAGIVGLWVMATAPLMVRYSAYSRPYALPLLLMVLFVFAAQRWIDRLERRWLVVAALAAVALPLARVAEPSAFLLTTAVTLGWFTYRGRFRWHQTRPLIAIAAVALVAVAYPMYRALSSQLGSHSLHLGRVFGHFQGAVHELVTGFVPLVASWFPWWPITLIALVAAVTMRAARRRLARWWFFWPLLAPPVIWVLAYHFLSPYSLDNVPYRPRSALFFVPVYVLVIVAVASALAEASPSLARRARAAVVVLLAAALAGQLPTTGRVLVKKEAADYEEVADVLTTDVPRDGIVLYDTAAPVWTWHQPFSAEPRYMDGSPYVGRVASLMHTPESVPAHGPVYVLFLDSRCAFSTLCDEPPHLWKRDVPGWKVVKRFDRFTLYEPIKTLSGRKGVITALRQFGRALGPILGAGETFTAASLLKLRGHPRAGRAVIRQMYAHAGPAKARSIQLTASRKKLSPFA